MQVLYYVGVKRKNWGFIAEWRYTSGQDQILNVLTMAVKNGMDALCNKHNRSEKYGCVMDYGYLDVIKVAPLVIICDYTRRNGKLTVDISARPQAEDVSVRTANFCDEFVGYLRTLHRQFCELAKEKLKDKSLTTKTYHQAVQSLEVTVHPNDPVYAPGGTVVPNAIKRAADNTIELIKQNRQKVMDEQQTASQGSVLPAK